MDNSTAFVDFFACLCFIMMISPPNLSAGTDMVTPPPAIQPANPEQKGVYLSMHMARDGTLTADGIIVSDITTYIENARVRHADEGNTVSGLRLTVAPDTPFQAAYAVNVALAGLNLKPKLIIQK